MGEKLVWLGKNDKDRTFGEIYKALVNSLGFVYYVGDTGFDCSLIAHDEWGVIPRYEQVKNIGKGIDEVNEVKVLEKAKYTGKFKVGDEVKVVGLTSKNTAPKSTIGQKYVVRRIDELDKTFHYLASVYSFLPYWFNEAELELVSKRKEDRPASSHYHIDNNSNDVWRFADDNLSDERVKGFHQINAIGYVSRYNKKHDTTEKRIEDLEKAKVSIEKLIELEESE